ncbi:MAG: sigma-54 dependent transcriptional regulator [Planctomycetes bacterium]|nr:sigma-54 dependent transcriptional regulator [Planctomycetota bacterium]
MTSQQPAADTPERPRVLVVEDDNSYAELLNYRLSRDGYQPLIARTGEDGLAKAADEEPAVVLLDVMLPGKDGRQVLSELKQSQPALPVVMMTASGTIELAVECMKNGAYDFLTKPIEFERLATILRNAIEYRDLRSRVQALEGQLQQRKGFEQILARSPKMVQLIEQARRAAATTSDILILGESGSGKEVFARAIHYSSVRAKGPFVAINCGAIPETLLESELFGHEKGSFTGAVNRRAGCFEQANGGTLFLDEIGEIRPEMQVRLLRALEQREVRRVGGDKTVKVDVRVISATNQDVRSQVKSGGFRTDLYYRLAILVLDIPPLRERLDDIGPLAQFFLREAQADGHTRATAISPEAVDVLVRHDWPGNVRELRNAIERAVVFEDSAQLTVGSLPPEIVRKTLGQHAVPAPKVTETYTAQTFKAVQAAAVGAPGAAPLPPGTHEVPRNQEIRPMDEEEKNIIVRALSVTGGNVSEAARRLGLHRSTLHRKMARYGLATDEDQAAGEGESE